MSGGGYLLPKFMLIWFFGRVSRFLGVSGTPTPIRKILVRPGVLHCLVPSWPEMMQIRIF